MSWCGRQELNKTVLLVDRCDHIGGNTYDGYNDAGILEYFTKYGPHWFHTNDKMSLTTYPALPASVAISDVASSLDINAADLYGPSQRRQIDVQANTAILNELVRNLEIPKVTLRKDTPLIEIIDHPILPLMKTTLSPLKATLVGAAVAGFLVILILTLQIMYKSIMA